MKIKHVLGIENKRRWFGDGEWVEEADRVTFEHCGLECEVIRVCAKEPYAIEEHYFGGYLNGYVTLKEGMSIEFMDERIEVHGGITFNGQGIVGFDCAHFGDLNPSIKKLKDTLLKEDLELRELIKLRDEALKNQPTPWFLEDVYRNLEYVINETKHLAEQIWDLHRKKE
jgi:hypothetical protein